MSAYLIGSFSDLDNNGNGTVDAEDVQYGVQKIRLPSEYAANVLSTLHSTVGEISLEDFASLVLEKESDVQKIFEMFDKKKTGRICARELQAILDFLEVPVSSADVLAELGRLEEGALTFEEFRSGFALMNRRDISHIKEDWLEYAAEDNAAGASGIVTRKSQLPHKEVAAWTSAVAGGIGNAFSRTAIAPLERTRMQMITDPGRYKSMTECLSTIYEKEGLKGLWRGNYVNVMRIAPQGAIGFFAKDYFKQLFAGKGKSATPLQTLAASMSSGIVTQTTTYPLDVIRTRLTTTPGIYNGVVDGFQKIIKQEGAPALFKGLLPANFFAVPYYGTQFFVYDMLKLNYATFGMPPGEARPMHPLIGIPFGSIASCCSCIVAFPLQMAWKRIQVQGIGDRPVLYDGPVDCLVKVIRTEGARGVYSGLTANLVKLAPTGALTFACVEFVKATMGWN